MSAPIDLWEWQPPLYMPALAPSATIVCCRRHYPPQRVDPGSELLLGHLIMHAFIDLPWMADVKASGPHAIVAAARSAGPICCVLGEERIEAIYRRIPAVWALRS